MASHGRVAREQVEVLAQGAAVLRHLLAPVELCAGGVALPLLDKSVHLERQKEKNTQGPKSESLAFPWCQNHREGGETEQSRQGEAGDTVGVHEVHGARWS